ncbi:MAG: hypothetical protein AAF512_21785 [Pseudomonadota bacterium]
MKTQFLSCLSLVITFMPLGAIAHLEGLTSSNQQTGSSVLWFIEHAALPALLILFILLSFVLTIRINRLQKENRQIQENSVAGQFHHFQVLQDANQELLLTEAKLIKQQAQLEQLVRQRTDELEAAKRHIQENERRLSLAIQGAQDGIWDWNSKPNEEYWSPKII